MGGGGGGEGVNTKWENRGSETFCARPPEGVESFRPPPSPPAVVIPSCHTIT